MGTFKRWIASRLGSATKAVRRRVRRKPRTHPRSARAEFKRFFRQPSSYVLMAAGILLAAMLFWPSGCTPTAPPPAAVPEGRLIRVCLLEKVDQVSLSASQSPAYSTDSDSNARTLMLPARTPMAITLAADGWHIGNTRLGTGSLTLRQAADGTLQINGTSYRGSFRLVPRGAGRFDVVNDVDIDDYLKGVLAAEMFPKWHDEAFKAQAIVARTYALYQKYHNRAERGMGAWDVYGDTRDQMYSGMPAETPRTRAAVDATSGIVVAYAAPGQEPHIFKAYFSSCCGGISQSALDAFGDPYIPALSDQNVGGTCNKSDKFNWGPVVIGKDELTRRFRKWGAANGRPEKDMPPVRRVAIEKKNQYGRPVRFTVVAGTSPRDEVRYSLTGEELRRATNTDGVLLFSSYVNVVSDDMIRFVDGHGYGHGVGMCQYCAEARAEQGYRCEDIVRFAYPQSQLAHAY